jgi:hypothetical protein
MIEVALLLFAFVVVVPSIAAAIGYAAWKGKPRISGETCIGRPLLLRLQPHVSCSYIRSE